MTGPVEVRPAGPDDLADAGRITAGAYLADGLLPDDHDYLDELRDAASRAEQAQLLVAARDGRVLGTITLAMPGTPYAEIAHPGEAELRMLAVDPVARGQGIGELLLREAMRRAHEQGAGSIVLTTLEAMRAARRIYDRLGLERAPERDWEAGGYRLVVYSGPLPLGAA